MNTKTLLISAAIAFSFTAVPAHAQFGSGTSYDDKPTTAQTKSQRKAEKKKQAAMKKLEEAQAKKEAMELELKRKEQMAQQDGKAYGSGTTEDALMKKDDALMKKGEMKSYGSGTSEDAMMKKDDAMMKKNQMQTFGFAAPIGKPTNCPQGTTPQDNGTCLLTGGSLPIN